MCRAAADRISRIWLPAVVLSGLLLAADPGGPSAYADAGSAAGSGAPTTTVTVVDDHTLRYCVAGFAPGKVVRLHDYRTGRDSALRPDNRGAGCRHLPFTEACTQLSKETIVATGTVADGNPAMSRATVTPPRQSKRCPYASDSPGAGLHGSAAEILGGAVAGVFLLGLGAGVIAFRRRRTSG